MIRESDVASARPSFSRYASLALVFAVLAGLAIFVDLPVSRFAQAGMIGGDIVRIIYLSEVFAHGSGILMIALTIFVLDPDRRRQLPRVLITVYGAGLVALAGKCLVARVRPQNVDDLSSATETFVGWLPILRDGDAAVPWDVAYQSFPSGHTASAVALAIGLSHMYPRGRWLFALFAAMAACQRIVVGMHYPSDTLAAAAVACLTAALMFGNNSLSRWFERFERNGRSVELVQSDSETTKPMRAA